MSKKIKKILNKKNKSKVICLTAYSKNIASILDKYCDLVLVGDSLGSVLYNYKSTKKVTLEMMINHSKSVRLGVKKSLMVVDMPFNTYRTTKEALKNSISSYNVGTLEDMYSLNLFEFGIYLDLVPDEEEKAQLENNIQAALKTNTIHLEDAVEIRDIKNLKLANQFLKLKRKQKAAEDQKAQQANIQAQANANAEASERSAAAEMQKQQALAETTLQIAQGKSNFEINKMQQEYDMKKQMMEMQFLFDKELKQMEVDKLSSKEKMIEDRKDDRTRLEGTQQSEMIQQRNLDLPPIDFNQGGQAQDSTPQGLLE